VSSYDSKQIVLASVRALVRELDVSSLPSHAVVDLIEWFAALERLASAGKTLCAARVDADEVWKADGSRDAAEWLASRTGTSVGAARSLVDTSKRLPATARSEAALRAGELSAEQANHVTHASAAAPAHEQRLLAMTQTHSLKKLRDECARVRHVADADPDETRRRIHATRYWRRWNDADGARCGSYRLTPDDAAAFESAVQPFLDQRLDDARRAGARESTEAYAADALVAMASASVGGGTGTPHARGGRGRKRMRDRRELLGIVNLESLRRDAIDDGKLCEVAGVGPVPLSTLRDLFGDALLRVVIRDGVDIRTVVHTGRTANALQETAVLARSLGMCEVDRCDLPVAEIDHRIDYSRTGPASIADLAGVCGHHHDDKTRRNATWHPRDDGGIAWISPP
jgi:hypothetical protein